MSRSVFVTVLLAVLAGFCYLAPARAVSVEPVKGAWLSPDWLFPGPQSYSEQDVRRIVHDNLVKVKEQGVNTIFLETMLRGTTICPTTTLSNGTLQLSNNSIYPIYKPLNFGFRIENGAPVDTLQIFVQEGAALGIRVHAWCHMFYWRMDNDDVVPTWKEGPSAWDDLLLGWLRQEHDALKVQKGDADPVVVALDQARAMVLAGYDGAAFEKILTANHIACEHNPLGSLVKAVVADGGDLPSFLLTMTPDDPFPAHKVLRAVFVDPENATVENRIIAMVSNIVQSHPGLAGVQLDHVRYPTGPMGTPPELGLLGLGVNGFEYFDPNNPILNDRYEKTIALLTHRREVMQNFVNRLRRYIGGRVQLSAAILPQYNRERNQGRYRISYWEFVSQDWYHWDVDFVVPLMYELPAWKIRTLMIRYREDLQELYGDMIPIQIYPGVSRLQQAESGLLNQEDWVYFDLKLADDVHIAREQQVDPVTTGPEPAASATPAALPGTPGETSNPPIIVTPEPAQEPQPVPVQ